LTLFQKLVRVVKWSIRKALGVAARKQRHGTIKQNGKQRLDKVTAH